MRSGRTKVLLVQLGSPKSPSVDDVRLYLKEFLGDPRVVDINPVAWKLILNLFVLPFRPKKSAEAYSRIWDGNSFPLITNTQKFAQALNSYLDPDCFEVDYAFLLSEPRVSDIWNKWEQDRQDSLDKSASRLLIIPMFPQYSESTIASGMDLFFKELERRVQIPTFEIWTHFHDSKAFIDSSVRQIRKYIASHELDAFVISFHGIPKRRVIYKKDDYYRHCFETYEFLKKGLPELADKMHMTFQSRFGSEEWLTPYNDEYCLNLVNEGKKKIGIYCPSFVADCLETTDEIGTELGHEINLAGGELIFVPCLNDDQEWAKGFASLIEGSQFKEKNNQLDLYYKLDKEEYINMEQPKMKSPPMSDKAKSTLKIVFLTLFLDLVGFSIIFPLFPSLAKYYLEVDSQNYFLNLIFGSITKLTQDGGANIESIVLFGGALGALYSFLQFLAAPVWGTLSDRVGRRPILLISVFGLAVSYLLWFISGNFTMLIFARFIGGIMGGNISTATAVVGDITDKENRSKGMAIIGISFALGFIVGPALGGILSLVRLDLIFPDLVKFGVNPFSAPALLAFLLCMFNVFWVWKKFEETLPEEKRGQKESDRSVNPLILFKPLPYKGVNLTNFGHFLFLAAFSGMEFTLTFLAVERLSYTSMQNAYMFIYIGFLIVLTQGGYVRRKANIIGERNMAMRGLVTLIPGLILIGLAHSSLMLYAGLFFLSIGSSMVIPCLTSLVSLYTPAEYQGRSIGIFRSLGAFARVVGPIAASLIYWKFGDSYPYFLGALFLIIPIIMVKMLPEPNKA